MLALALGVASCVPWEREAPTGQAGVELPPGMTRLAEAGTYTVAYRLYDNGKRVEMPPGWSGHFTEDVGIAYYEHGVHDGRRAYVLHCPWKRGTGSVSLEIPLALPDRRPIVLRFAVAMRPDVVEKSDGVTFSAFIVHAGGRQEIFRKHYAKSAWHEEAFDLSAFAGQEVTLGFQTEPGRARNSSFDFSLLGEPTLTIGKAKDTASTVLREVTRSRAYRVARDSDLTELANASDRGVVPGTNEEHETRLDLREHAAGFFYHGTDCQVEYAVPLLSPMLDGMVARVNDGRPFRPCAGGGVWLAPEKGNPHDLRRPDLAERLSVERRGEAVAVRWRYHLAEQSAEVTWTFRLVGKALAIAAEAEGPGIARLSLGAPLNQGLRRTVAIPYLNVGEAYFLRPQNVYVMSYLDWTRSLASRTPTNEAFYLPDLEGNRQPLREAGYVAVSPEFGEVLPNIPHPSSPFREELGGRIVLDIWGGTFERGAELLATLKSHGVDHAAVIWHNWQRYGYDVKLPDHLPPNPALGGRQGMTRLAQAARDAGYLFSLHENYIDFYPDAPSYEEADVVLAPDGEPSKAWFNEGTQVQSYALKAGRMLHYAAENSPDIHRRYNTNAAYLDVHTCVPPWHHVDYDPATKFAASHHLKVGVHKRLFQYERDVHGGPLFGEGANHFFWAGLVDGVEAQVSGGEDRELLLDFDLLKLHPQMVNHGMGYYPRWLRTGYGTRWGVEAPTPAQLDEYRATEIAYGHAGFVSSPLVYTPRFVWREHNLVQPVQARYATGTATEILYEVDGRLITASAAIPTGAPLDRIRVTYEGGLVVHVNLREEDWEVDSYVLPQHGFLAEGPGLTAYTARRDGVIADYAENEEFLFADARTNIYRPWEQERRDTEPFLKEIVHRGNDALDVTYGWRVGEQLKEDYTAFVHFVEPDTQDGKGIRFQDDHAPRPPTSAWEPGTVVSDGPRRVQLPLDQEQAVYDVVIGLYGSEGRLALKGTAAGRRRVLIGRLAVERRGGGVATVKLLPIAEEQREQRALRRRFLERMNAAGASVDFGAVRTDGSVKLYKREDALTLLPYPRETEFVVQLDIATLVPGRRGDEAVVHALASDGNRLGPVRAASNRRWLTFRVGRPEAARYAITFPETDE